MNAVYLIPHYTEGILCFYRNVFGYLVNNYYLQQWQPGMIFDDRYRFIKKRNTKLQHNTFIHLDDAYPALKTYISNNLRINVISIVL